MADDAAALAAGYTPQQIAVAKARGMMMSNGLPSVPPNMLKVNSRGESYSPEVTSMPEAQKRNVASAMRAIAHDPRWAARPGDPTAAPSPAPQAASLTPAFSLSPRAQTVVFWMSKGAPRHVAEGIADRVQAESSHRSAAWNPDDKGSPSGGLYQHHADRLQRLMAQPNWRDPMTQHQFAYSEVTGGDAQATKHWNEILAAPDRATAAKLWDRYFERSAGGPGAAGGGVAGGTRRMVGPLGGMGPRVPIDIPDLTGAAKPAPAAPAPPAPQQQTEKEAPGFAPQLAAAPASAFRPSPVSPIGVTPTASLQNVYRDALASILNGRRRGLGSIFG